MERSVIYLLQVSTDKLVEAELFDGISDPHLEAWRKTWLPEVAAAKIRLLNNQLPGSQWPVDLHWDWDKKMAQARATFLGRKSFCVLCQGELQGLMLVNLTKTGRLPEQVRKELVYVEFLSTAPWNRQELACTPKISGCWPGSCARRGRTQLAGGIPRTDRIAFAAAGGRILQGKVRDVPIGQGYQIRESDLF